MNKFSVITDTNTGKMSTVLTVDNNSAEQLKQTKAELRAMLSGNVQFHTDEFAKPTEVISEPGEVAFAQVPPSHLLHWTAHKADAAQQMVEYINLVGKIEYLKNKQQVFVVEHGYAKDSTVCTLLQQHIETLIMQKQQLKVLLNSWYLTK